MTGEVEERPKAVSILVATTDAATSEEFSVRMSPVVLRVLGASAIAGAEVVQVEYQDAGGAWHDYVHALLGNMQLVAGETAITIYDTGRYRADKAATAGAVGLEILGRDYA